jgi:hypothetical protein
MELTSIIHAIQLEHVSKDKAKASLVAYFAGNRIFFALAFR